MVRLSVKKRSEEMELKKLLDDYEIGGIGDIKKHTLRFHSYRIGIVEGMLTIFAEYTSGQFPTVYKGYPSGQELLIELCNLNLELRDKPLKECAEILIRWSLENIHPYYHYGDDVAALEQVNNDADQYWDMLVNVIECYSISVKDMVQDLEWLYTDTMTLFAIRSLMEGKITDAQRIYGEVRVPNEKNLLHAWYRADSVHRPLVLQDFIENIPKLKMGLEYDLSTGQIQLQPVVKSVVDAAYFGLARFMAVNANALDDYGGKTNIAFCQACGKAFIKRGNRQKYCGTLECQSVRNKLKSKEHYYRERAKSDTK